MGNYITIWCLYEKVLEKYNKNRSTQKSLKNKTRTTKKEDKSLNNKISYMKNRQTNFYFFLKSLLKNIREVYLKIFACD